MIIENFLAGKWEGGFQELIESFLKRSIVTGCAMQLGSQIWNIKGRMYMK